MSRLKEGYLELPSNVDSDAHKNNTNAHYIVPLVSELRLEGAQYEVALTGMIYSNTWDNVTIGSIFAKRREINGIINEFTVPVPKGRYKSISELLLLFNNSLSSFNLNETLKLEYNEIENIMVMRIYDVDYEFSFSEDLAWIFGYVPNVWYKAGKHKNVNAPDITTGLTSLYVYSDIADNRDVGNALVPLLRIVKVEGQRNSIVQKEFQHPQYVPASNIQKREIEVFITSDDGKLIPFKGGKVCLTVHYRPRPQN